MSDNIDIYLAGFVDGEGCIEIIKYYHKDRGKYTYTLCIRANNTKEKPINLLYNHFGGHTVKRVDKRNKRYKILYGWCAKSTIALEALKALLPYLLIKEEEAELGILFQETKKNLKFKSVDEDKEQKWRESCYQQMRKLK